jgi:hypothetical protein
MAVMDAVSRPDQRGIAEPVCALRAGDVVRIGAEQLLVTADPMTMHRGLGLFDDFALFIGIDVQRADGGAPRRRLVLEPDTPVVVLSRHPEA